MNKEKLKGILNILDEFIKEEEKEILVEKLQEINIEIRVCSVCSKFMNEGFVIDNGERYYCTKECLEKEMTIDEFEEQYKDGEGDSYYTAWE